MSKNLDQETISELTDVANKLRILSIQSTNEAKSGHPTSCCSMAEIMSVLFFHTMRYSIKEPKSPSADRFVLSKGHAAPVLYAAWTEAQLLTHEELMKLRKIDSDLEGHPTPRLNFIDVATGSLGQGLSCAVGMAYTGKYFDKASYRVFCVIGDGESAEGSIWEALSFASIYKLDNMVAIFDINRLGQSQETAFEHQLESYRSRLESFGFNTIVLDGHDILELCKAFSEAENTKGRPTAILAKTFKGKGINGIEDKLNWHGKPLGDKANDAIKTIKALIQNPEPTQLKPKPIVHDAPEVSTTVKLSEPPNYKIGDAIATRFAYGTALVKLSTNNPRVIGMDGDTKNSTYSDRLLNAFNDRFIECYIAEQNLVGVAIGCATRNRTIPFVSTFAAFFTRAFDQLRMGAISQTTINCVGSHAGCSIGEDGPSQMALEDLAMFRSIPGCVVFYPSDAVSTERACELAANHPSMCFIRTSRPTTKIIYGNDERMEIGKAKVVRKSDKDKVLIIGAAVTLQEATIAADTLEASGIKARVMDLFTIKPIDKEAIIKNALEVGGTIVTVEDHYPEGGIGEAVASAVSEERNITVTRLAVKAIPRSGPSAVLMDMFGISARCIVEAVKKNLA